MFSQSVIPRLATLRFEERYFSSFASDGLADDPGSGSPMDGGQYSEPLAWLVGNLDTSQRNLGPTPHHFDKRVHPRNHAMSQYQRSGP
jgi:hypothetical protein